MHGENPSSADVVATDALAVAAERAWTIDDRGGQLVNDA
jgi:hypothetical protein